MRCFLKILVILAIWPFQGRTLELDLRGTGPLKEEMLQAFSYLPSNLTDTYKWTLTVTEEALPDGKFFGFAEPKDWLGQGVRFQKLVLSSRLRDQSPEDRRQILLTAAAQLVAGPAGVETNPGFLHLMKLHESADQSATEFFAQEFAQYLSLSSYLCAKPDLSLWFARAFQLSPYIGSEECPNLKPVDSVTLVSVTPGDNFIESWGHIMFRIRSGTDDIIVSFYAEQTLGLWDGFKDVARAKAFIYNYAEEAKAYQADNGRKLHEFEFDPTKTDIQLLAASLIQASRSQLPFWNHVGNNCATNAFHMIQLATPELWRKEKVRPEPSQLVYQMKSLKLIKPKENP